MCASGCNVKKAKQSKGGKLVKGSQEAKDRMATMRAMRKGVSVAPVQNDIEGGKLIEYLVKRMLEKQ